MPDLSSAYNIYNLFTNSARAGKTTRSRTRHGSERLVNERFRIVDDTRSTPAYAKYRELPYRELHGEIWRPAACEQPTPVVVYSHGFMSNRRESMYLVRFLASHGYTVVAANFPLTGRHTRGPKQPRDIVNQPGDISCVIDYMLARNQDPADGLFRCLDPDKIALAGLSLGALTTLLATYHRDWADPRIAAMVAIAAPTSMFSEKFYSGTAIPALLIYGDSDSLVHHDDHALLALQRMQNATLVSLKKGSHAGFSQYAATALRFLKNPDSMSCAALRLHLDDRPWDFVSALGSERVGVVEPHEEIAPLTRPMVPVAMKAARQHMFTSLATHAFLESHFGTTQARRQAAHRYLHRTLPREHGAEVTVERRAD